MQITRSQCPSRRQRPTAALLALLALFCAGCRSCRPVITDDVPDAHDGGARVETSAPDVESTAPTMTGDLTPRPVAPSVESLDREAHDSGLIVDVYFDFDRSELTAQARSGLEHNARYLRASPAVQVLIEGHCDERGTHEYNLALGQLRAAAARAYLVRLGIAADRLGTLSYGEDRGVCHASNESCWAKNRRAYFRIVGL